MTSKEVMRKLYPSLPEWKLDANAEWLDNYSELVMDGGIISSPRDTWIVRKVSKGNYEIVAQLQ